MKVLRIVITGEEPPYYTITEAFKKRFEVVDTIYWNEIENLHDMNSIVRARVTSIKYDVVFMQIQHPNIITRNTAELLSQNALVFNWTGDVRTDITWYKEIAPYVVTLFTNMTDVLKIRAIGCQADYLQTGYDHRYYYNINKGRHGNIAFCGNYYPEADFPLKKLRVDAVRHLKNEFPQNFHLYGKTWDAIGIKSEGFANNEWEANLYNESLLALSISHFNYSRYFSDRLLREMACGCCVLSHRFLDNELEFKEGEHIVYWDNFTDLSEKINHYFKNPSEAIKIGQSAASYVKENYSWDKFTENFLNIILKYKHEPTSSHALSGLTL
jgi:spore maturation protein CgeB